MQDDPRRVFFVKDLMDPQNQSPPEDSYDPVWWNQTDQQNLLHSDHHDPSSMSSGFGSPMQLYQESDHFSLHDRSSSPRSYEQSHRELFNAIFGEINFDQGQHVLPEQGQGSEQISLGKKATDESTQVIKEAPFSSNPNHNSLADQPEPQIDQIRATVRRQVQAHAQAHAHARGRARARVRLPHPYAAGLSVGIPIPSDQSRDRVESRASMSMIGMIPAKVLLPSFDDVEEDGPPIYVNPRQYIGILRRRHCRARLVSENKIITTRRPYMHESRHLHAKFRARGIGGRFLGKDALLLESLNSASRSSGNGNDDDGGDDFITFLDLGEGNLWRDMSTRIA